MCLTSPGRAVCFLAAGLVCLSLPTPPARAQEGSWVGKTVLVTHGNVRFGYTNEEGVQVYLGRLDEMVYTVLQEQGPWVQVRQRGVEGWLPKKDAVLLEKAIPYFTRRIRANGDDSEAYARRGSAWHLLGELDMALKDYQEALRLDPKSSALYGNRAGVYLDLRDYDRAIDDCTQAIRLNPKNFVAYNSRGAAFSRKGDYGRAVGDYTEAIRLHRANPQAYNNRGAAYWHQGEYDRAIEDYTEAIRLDPKFASAYRNRGLAHQEKKEYAKAVQDYTEAVRLNPKYHWPYADLAWLWATCPQEEFRNGPKAVAYARRACELTQWKDADSLAALAVAYAEAGDLEEAVRWQKKAREVGPAAKDH
jgi:tetratricopeptide (TPR) repeat protein